MEIATNAQPVVIKVGGHDISDRAFLTELAETVRGFAMPVIIVHGGGDEIAQLQKLMQIETQYSDGLRVTDASSLAVVEMVLCGVVNKRVVRALLNAGVDAIGLSGVDRGLVMARPIPNMGFTGEVVEVRGKILQDVFALGVTPVIAPVCMGGETSLNVNADHVAGAIAGAVGAARVIFVTNVPGVIIEGQVATQLTSAEAEQFIRAGVIFGGMIPKVRTALEVLTRSPAESVITNLAGLRENAGTRFSLHSD